MKNIFKLFSKIYDIYIEIIENKTATMLNNLTKKLRNIQAERIDSSDRIQLQDKTFFPEISGEFKVI